MENEQDNTVTITLPPEVDRIIAIAQKVLDECPNQFEQMFQAIMDTVYKG